MALCICIYFVPFIWNFVLHFVQFCVFCIQNTSFTFCSFFQETMPEWPPLILDQANNLLVRNIHFVLYFHSFPKVANETSPHSGVRRLSLPTGETATLYCPKKTFENYPGRDIFEIEQLLAKTRGILYFIVQRSLLRNVNIWEV